jgi:hypothetical protein
MFWILFLAHLIADYPLQPDRLVVAKKHLQGLTVHIAIHWVTMLFLTWPVQAIIWPYILAVAVLHFGIDYFKVVLGHKRPQWVIGPYLWDQPLHWISLLIAGFWMSQTTDLSVWEPFSAWWIYAAGLLMSTHIWFVTERVLVYRNRDLQIHVVESMWPRMGARLLLYILLAAAQPATLVLVLPVLGVLVYLYNRFHYPRQWVIIDAVIALVSTVIVLLILAYF